jgi:hypothetical protein
VAIAAAAIAGAATIAGAGISSSSSKKAGDAQEKLAEIAGQLFSETGPLRERTLQDAMAALMGETSAAGTPLVQAQQSAISREGAKTKASTRESLAKRGLSGSAVAIAEEEDVDRAIANLMSQARTSDVASLVNLGRQIGFGQVPQQAIGAYGTLANIQGQQAIAAGQQSGAAGGAAGQLLAMLLKRQLDSKNTTVANVSGGSGGGGGYNVSTGAESGDIF